MPAPRFTVIVVHYQGVNPPAVFARGINSVLGQTFGDAEVLCYHDGPLLDEAAAAASPVPIRCTPTRHNDFGHSLRDLGIREAKGEYIVHFNADNLLYPDALATIDAELRRPPRLRDITGRFHDSDNIVIFPILMHDHERFMDRTIRVKGGGGAMILTGNPPVAGGIDCMQLVMRRKLWLDEGGWSDRRPDSDGRLYARFGPKYGYRGVARVLGEHF